MLVCVCFAVILETAQRRNDICKTLCFLDMRERERRKYEIMFDSLDLLE